MDQTRIEKEKTIKIDGLSKMAPPIIQRCSTTSPFSGLFISNRVQ